MSSGDGVIRGVVSTLEHLPLPAYALSTEGTIVAWNPALARLTGVSARALIGKGGGAHAGPFLGSTGRLLADIVLDRSLETPGHLSAIEPSGDGLSARCAVELSGERRLLSVRAAPIVDEGAVLGAIEVVLEMPPSNGDGRSTSNATVTRLQRITRHDIKNELTIVLGYIGLARDAVEDPITVVGLDRAASAAGEIERLIEFTRELEEFGLRPPEGRELGSLIRTAADAADLGGIDHEIAIPRGTVMADPIVFSVFDHLFERLFLYSAATIPRPSAIRVEAHNSDPFRIVYEDDAPHNDRSVHPDRAFCRGLDSGLAGVRELLALDGIEFSVTPAPLRVELRIPGDRVLLAEKTV